MTRLTARDFAPERLELCDFCAHGLIAKRACPHRAARRAMDVRRAIRPDDPPWFKARLA